MEPCFCMVFLCTVWPTTPLPLPFPPSRPQDFVGSNNINLLFPSGQFGTRLQGGKDAASARWGQGRGGQHRAAAGQACLLRTA